MNGEIKIREAEGVAIQEAEGWRFTGEPMSWENGEPYRRQTTDGKDDRRTVRVDPDSPDTILEIL